ncbi:hypothetical protein [Meiothermus cerbereus]|uniref:hypothetical protein n=1 Tax=Meiothermus cerbereus TaxID=65552 RepID=UPI003EED9CAF
MEEKQKNEQQVVVQQIKDMEPFSIGGIIVVFVLCMLLTPIVGLIAYLFFSSSAPVKARQSAIIALVSLGIWVLFFVLLGVGAMLTIASLGV